MRGADLPIVLRMILERTSHKQALHIEGSDKEKKNISAATTVTAAKWLRIWLKGSTLMWVAVRPFDEMTMFMLKKGTAVMS
jgi:hypothetical protein